MKKEKKNGIWKNKMISLLFYVKYSIIKMIHYFFAKCNLYIKSKNNYLEEKNNVKISNATLLP
jgi:hypothetical protein